MESVKPVKDELLKEGELAAGGETVEGRKLRDAFGCFATGVAVITTVSARGRPVGITVNSFSSVSLDPPLILWSLSRDSGLVKHFAKDTPFAVNILAGDQENLARHFSAAGGDRFEDVAIEPGANGAPLIPGNAGFLECEVTDTVPGGDHVIVVGRVTRFECGTKRPLVFHKGCFTALE